MYIYIYICIYIYLQICIYVYVCVCICIYIYRAANTLRRLWCKSFPGPALPTSTGQGTVMNTGIRNRCDLLQSPIRAGVEDIAERG